MYLLCETNCFTLKKIGTYFGFADHSTIVNARDNIRNFLNVNDARTISTKQRFDKHLNTINNNDNNN
jgi:chromosomal replication initiation ATPase DnaA